MLLPLNPIDIQTDRYRKIMNVNCHTRFLICFSMYGNCHSVPNPVGAQFTLTLSWSYVQSTHAQKFKEENYRDSVGRHSH